MQWTPKKIVSLAASVVGLILLVVCLFGLFEKVNADEIVVIQDPFDGELHIYTDSGLKVQAFGKVTRYKKSSQYWFSASPKEGSKEDTSIRVRFNDGGHAYLSGSLRFDLPRDHKLMSTLHQTYGSQWAIEHELIGTHTIKAVYMTGPLMSSKESYADRRPDLISFISDQVMHGVYKTTRKDVMVDDPITGQKKPVSQAVITLGPDGALLRQEGSPLETFAIMAYNFNITAVKYDDDVEKQIKAQQQATMEVQTAMAESRKAEQRALTAEAEGKAAAAKAKWDQEVQKATAVTRGQQEKEVAELNATKEKEVAKLGMEAAEYKKQEQILLGEGEAARKEKVMRADGALAQKLEAWVQVNRLYAAELGKQRWVPEIVVGGSAGQNGSSGSAYALLDMLMIKTAKELGLDMSILKSK